MYINGYEIAPYTDLRRANLQRANLYGVNLYEAMLYGANLYKANLYKANFGEANLRRANLGEAYLYKANLGEANLSRANLSGANLCKANLDGANLYGADLCEADLRGANLFNAKLPHFDIPAGDLVGWKKCGGTIVELLIPSRAQRTGSLVGRKCRAQFAFVRKVHDTEVFTVTSDRGGSYTEGKEVWPDSYNPDPRVECTHGIHFFLTKREAEEW